MKSLKISDHYDGSRFFNPDSREHKNGWDLLKWQLTANRQPWPKKIEIPKAAPLQTIIDENQITVTYINHATVLIQTKDFNILTDPIWSQRTSPFQWAGPKRIYQPPFSMDELPRIDFVLVSHNHYDHLDSTTVKLLHKMFYCRFIVALGDKKRMNSMGLSLVEELDWGQEVIFSNDLKVIFTPSQHWSARGLWDKNKSLWGSFLILYKGKKIYFAGDTGYSMHFKELHKKYGSIDLALLPIGAYEPRWFMKAHHMNPAEAVQAHLDLKAVKSMGIHFGTFRLTDEGPHQPVLDLQQALLEKKIPREEFLALSPGKSISLF
jgi:L-ascorbate metabolism protein UlaG (beta-lactamase superfamily)